CRLAAELTQNRRCVTPSLPPVVIPQPKKENAIRRLTASATMENTLLPESPLSQDLLSYSRAYWVARSLIAWNVDEDDNSIYLYASKKANMFLSDDGVGGYDVKIQLEPDHCALPANVTEKFPHIKDYRAFKVPNSDVQNLLKSHQWEMQECYWSPIAWSLR
ncbi:Pullulanase 1, chloroplastic, partial [Ananas comosus]